MAVRAAMAVPIAPVFMTTKEAEEEAAAMEQEPSRAGQIDDGRGFLAHPSTGGCQVVDLDGLSLFAVSECVCVSVCMCAHSKLHTTACPSVLLRTFFGLPRTNLYTEAQAQAVAARSKVWACNVWPSCLSSQEG